MPYLFRSPQILIGGCYNRIILPPDQIFLPGLVPGPTSYTITGGSAVTFGISGDINDPFWEIVSDPGLTPGLTPAAYIIDPFVQEPTIFFEDEYVAGTLSLKLTTLTCPSKFKIWNLATRLQSELRLTSSFYSQRQESSPTYEVSGPLFASSPTTGDVFFASASIGETHHLSWYEPQQYSFYRTLKTPWDFFINTQGYSYTNADVPNPVTQTTQVTSGSFTLGDSYYIQALYDTFDGYNIVRFPTPEFLAEAHSPVHLLISADFDFSIEDVVVDDVPFAELFIDRNYQESLLEDQTISVYLDQDTPTVDDYDFFTVLTVENISSGMDTLAVNIDLLQNQSDVSVSPFDFFEDLGGI